MNCITTNTHTHTKKEEINKETTKVSLLVTHFLNEQKKKFIVASPTVDWSPRCVGRDAEASYFITRPMYFFIRLGLLNWLNLEGSCLKFRVSFWLPFQGMCINLLQMLLPVNAREALILLACF